MSQVPVVEEGYSWEVSYGLLLWLSIVILVPFDLRSLEGADEENPERGFLDSVVDLCKGFLGDTGKTRDAAALLLANVLSRYRFLLLPLLPFIFFLPFLPFLLFLLHLPASSLFLPPSAFLLPPSSFLLPPSSFPYSFFLPLPRSSFPPPFFLLTTL
jgi:hypothetical protein